jgi:hypothetical protein
VICSGAHRKVCSLWKSSERIGSDGTGLEWSATDGKRFDVIGAVICSGASFAMRPMEVIGVDWIGSDGTGWEWSAMDGKRVDVIGAVICSGAHRKVCSPWKSSERK